MFGSWAIPTIFILAIKRNGKNWYFKDMVMGKTGIKLREWTPSLKTAWHFKNKDEANKLASLVFDERIEYEVKAYTQWSINN